MNTSVYVIAEFDDGLQLIPALWYNADRNSSIWPTHFKSKFRINKAIMTREIPQNCEWDVLPVKRIFGRADSYEEGMEKLVLAEDTSNIEVSSDELKKKNRKRRRDKAKKILSSSSDEDICFNEDENNNASQTCTKLLSAYPKIGNFVSQKELSQKFKKLENNCTSISSCQKNTSYNKTVNIESFSKNTKDFTEKPKGDSDTENNFTREYQKLVLGKLNKVLYKLNSIENRMDILEDKMQRYNYSSQEEILIPLPITTFEKLKFFEEQLKEVIFKDEAINTFKLVGGNTAHIILRSILKKALTDDFAQHFSWTGKKANKRSFQNLALARIIIQAVRTTYKHVNDAEIADTISKWLAQAPVRIERAKHLTKENNNEQNSISISDNKSGA